jgi:hypothetical protein
VALRTGMPNFSGSVSGVAGRLTVFFTGLCFDEQSSSSFGWNRRFIALETFRLNHPCLII